MRYISISTSLMQLPRLKLFRHGAKRICSPSINLFLPLRRDIKFPCLPACNNTITILEPLSPRGCDRVLYQHVISPISHLLVILLHFRVANGSLARRLGLSVEDFIPSFPSHVKSSTRSSCSAWTHMGRFSPRSALAVEKSRRCPFSVTAETESATALF